MSTEVSTPTMEPDAAMMESEANQQSIPAESVPEGNVNPDEEEEEEDEDEDDVQIVLNQDSVGSFPKRPTFFRGKQQMGGQPNQTPQKQPQNQQMAGSNVMQAQQGPSPIVAQNQKNVFDIDIDSLEEKPWKKPGVDISDYFNYGFNEDTWRQYCAKQVQLRLEQSMQGRIKVYESKTTDQQKIDLPPELLALTEPSQQGRQQKRPPSQLQQARKPQEKSDGPPKQQPDRRRNRDQDDSVIQVLASGDDGGMAPMPPELMMMTQQGPPRDRSPDHRRDDRDRRDDRRRDDERRREDPRGYERRPPDSRERGYPGSDPRERSYRDDHSPTHKRSSSSSSRDRREEEDRSKRRR